MVQSNNQAGQEERTRSGSCCCADMARERGESPSILEEWCGRANASHAPGRDRSKFHVCQRALLFTTTLHGGVVQTDLQCQVRYTVSW